MEERPPMERALSTDVVMDIILSHLKVKDLLSCRKVSKFWNKSASSVLRRRSTTIRNILEETSLMKLQDCMTESLDFPFTGLKFGGPWKLKSPPAMEFFKNYGARFTRVNLGTSWETRFGDIAPILNHFPRLSMLEADWCNGIPPSTELSDSAAGHEDGRILSLPSLRTLRISSVLNADVLREVCTAASPLLRIECLSSAYMNSTYRILKALKRAGKLQALSVLKVDDGEDQEDYALKVDDLLSTETPALTKLDFNARGCISRKGLMKLLISSQHTLKELRLAEICPSELSSECPVLAKLITLSLCIDNSCEYVFQGSHGHKFPALKELILDTTWDFPISNFSDGCFIVPSLITIELDGHVNKDGMEELARSFPNVIQIKLHQNMFNFEYTWNSDPADIWSVGAFKFLEKLVIWDYTVRCPTKKLNYSDRSINFEKFRGMNMDSFLTGIPIRICENLRKNSQQSLIDSPFNEILRDRPSILQLKNLRELTVCVQLEYGLKELPEEPPLISMVSVWYALQMMPNLQAKFLYEFGSPSWRCKEKQRDKAVTLLKAAFKHVQPCIQLEPFFY